MSADDPNRKPTTQLVTDGGVVVRVRDQQSPARAPAPQRRPQPKQEPAPRVVVRPPPSPHEERDAFIRRIVEAHAGYLYSLLCRPGVNPASAEEMRQELYIVLTRWFDEHDEHELPRNDEAFLADVATNQLRNRSRRRRLPVDDGAEGEDVATSAPGPESELELAQRRARLEEHVGKLPKPEAEAFRCVDQEELTYKEAAERLGRPQGTVVTHAGRARARLADSIRDSDRAFEAGLRRRPGR